MRGPGYKTAGDVRRTWRCSRCGRERKLGGDITSLMCGCQEGLWMHIVAERIMNPRPLQRPSDVERHPIDFGIEPNAPLPVKPAATIIKPAITPDLDPVPPPDVKSDPDIKSVSPPEVIQNDSDEDDWGEGIL